MTAATFWLDGFIVFHVCFQLFASNHLTHGVDNFFFFNYDPFIYYYVLLYSQYTYQRTFNDNMELHTRRHLEIGYNKFPAKN